jgi:sugar lactone lactonase YvrE
MQYSQLKTSQRRRPARSLTGRRLSRAAAAAACALLVVLGGVTVWRVAAVNFFIISTVAGSGGTGNEVVTFNGARGVAFDPSNSAIIYVADTGNHVVRRVDTTTTPPTVTVVAGQFTVAATNPLDSGGIGDGGLAASAHLSSPSDIVFDASGNYYIADTGTNRIRKVNTQGTSATADDTISTVVGTGAVGSLNGDVSIATLFNPRGLGIDAAGSLYIADTGNHLIRKLVGSTVSTVAGNTVFGAVFADGVPATDSTLNGPLDVAVTGDNRIYIADTANHRVRVVGTDGFINTVAGGGTGIFSGDGPDLGTNLSLSSPSSLTANDNNGVYVADTGNHRLRFISSAGQMNTVAGRLTAHGTVARGYDGDGTAGEHSLDSPSGVGFFIQGANTGRVALMDIGNNRLRVIQVFTGLMTSATSDGSSGSAGDNGPATAAKLNAPLGVAVDAAGSVYIADTANHVVRKITGTTVTTVAGTAGVPGNAGEGVTAATAPLNKPTAVAVDASGVLYISDTGNNVVRKVDGGVITTAVASAPNPPTDFNPNPSPIPLNTPQGLALDSGGTLFIADTGNHRIVRLAAAFPVVTVAGRGEQGTSGDNGAPTEARLNFPYGVAADPTSGNIYIADTNNHRVRFVNFSTSKITTVIAATGVPRADFVGDGGPATSARLNTPVAVAVDSGGSLYVTDRGNNRIRRVVNGTINTVVGSGAVGFSGDGGSATLAALGYPNGLALGTAGLFIADTGNNRIRLAVPPSNNAPTLTNPGNQTVSEGATVGFTLAATDTDAGQTVSYSMSGAPVGATLDANTGAFSYSPDFSVIPNTVGASQTFTITFTATDSAVPSASDSETISLTVNNVNRPPTVSVGAVASPVEATSAAGASVALSATASDPDGDALTFAWKDGVPTIATTNPASPTLAIGTHSITLTVTDPQSAAATSSPAVAVTVQDTTPPVFAGVPSNVTQTISSGTSATVNFTTPTASDAVDGARAVTTTRSDGQTGNVFPVGTTTVTFLSSDTRGNTSSAGFTVTISNSGQPPAQDTTYNINAFAGSGGYGAASSSGTATAATFKQPSGVAVNAAGDVYLADAESRVIRRITGGTVFPFAGTGAKGATGDGGQATAATFNNPTGLAVDSSGNVYIADTNNHRVRKVTGTTITTIAGTGVAGFFGDAGPATSAQLSFPTAVAVDSSGNVYIADTGNNRVRKITGTTISTVAGNGAAGFSGDGGSPTAASLNYPSGLAVTSDGLTLYIADTGNNRVRRASGGVISTYAGTGSAGFGGDSGVATLAALNGPTGLAFDPNGNLLIADTDNERIRRVKLSDSVIVTVAGTGVIGNTGDGGAATSATLDTPAALAVHAATGNVYFADAGNLRARVLGPAAANNAAPVIAAIPASTVNVGQTTNVALSATDADGNSVTFTLAPGAPAFLSIVNANPPARTATLFISPACANLGVHSVQVQANDGTTTVTSPSFSVTVTDSLAACGPVNNQPPVAAFNSLASPVEATGPGGFTVSLNGLASSDPNNDPLTFQWTDNGTLFSTSATTARTLTLGTHTITLTVSDGQGGINSTSKTVLVRDTTAPTISVSPNAVSFTQAQTVVLPTPTVSDTVDTSVTVTNNAPASYPLGNTVVTFTATDDAGNSATASVTVTITSGGGGGGGGSTPSLTSISPASGKRNQTVQMTINGSGFDQGADVTIFGGGLTLSNVSISSTQITLSVRISSTATLSRRTVTVTNPNTQSATLSQAFQVTQ